MRRRNWSRRSRNSSRCASCCTTCAERSASNSRHAVPVRVVRSLRLTLEYAAPVRYDQSLPEPAAAARPAGAAAAGAPRSGPPRAPVERLSLELDGTAPAPGQQLGLFTPQLARAARLDWQLASLTIRYGPDRLLQARLRDPEALLPEERFEWQPAGQSDLVSGSASPGNASQGLAPGRHSRPRRLRGLDVHAGRRFDSLPRAMTRLLGPAPAHRRRPGRARPSIGPALARHPRARRGLQPLAHRGSVVASTAAARLLQGRRHPPAGAGLPRRHRRHLAPRAPLRLRPRPDLRTTRARLDPGGDRGRVWRRGRPARRGVAEQDRRYMPLWSNRPQQAMTQIRRDRSSGCDAREREFPKKPRRWRLVRRQAPRRGRQPPRDAVGQRGPPRVAETSLSAERGRPHEGGIQTASGRLLERRRAPGRDRERDQDRDQKNEDQHKERDADQFSSRRSHRRQG